MTSAAVVAVPDARPVGGLRRLWRALRKPQVFDALLVGFLLLTSLTTDRAEGPFHEWLWLLHIALITPLLFRRRWAFGVFLTIASVAFVQWALDIQPADDTSVLFALYAVAKYSGSRRQVVLAGLIAEGGVVLAAIRWAGPRDFWLVLILGTGTVTAAWVLGAYRRTRRAYVDSLVERAATAERERDQRALLAVADERARISREMHDIVAHTLSVMIALSDGASASVDTQPVEAKEAMEQSSIQGRLALAEMRRLLSVLHEASDEVLAPQPGIAQLDDLVAQVRSTGLPVELVIVGEPDSVSPSAELAVYRIVQESLTNVLKHAPAASSAVVKIAYEPDWLEVTVDNDEPSRIESTNAATTGHGLAGMRERVAVFGGTVVAGRRAEGGWRVMARLDLGRGQAGE